MIRTILPSGVNADNLFTMANTFDPRKFYRVTKAIVMPSLWDKSFGLVAAEAMANGIPVLASNRGALPETLGLKKGGQAPQADGSSDASNAGPRSQSPFFQGDGGMLFDIPACYTPETRIVPTAEEVEPWVEMILRLWDDEAFYRQQSEKAFARAAQWHPDRLRPLYVELFRNVLPQPGPPVVPRAPEGGTAVRPGLQREHHAKRDENSPYISVVTPVYNGAGTLERRGVGHGPNPCQLGTAVGGRLLDGRLGRDRRRFGGRGCEDSPDPQERKNGRRRYAERRPAQPGAGLWPTWTGTTSTRRSISATGRARRQGRRVRLRLRLRARRRAEPSAGRVPAAPVQEPPDDREYRHAAGHRPPPGVDRTRRARSTSSSGSTKTPTS